MDRLGLSADNANQIIATTAYAKIKYVIEEIVASELIYLSSHTRDFQSPKVWLYLDEYLRGLDAYSAEQRIRSIKPRELYGINDGGSTEDDRRYCLGGASPGSCGSF